MASAPVKILTVGAARGFIKELFAKVKAIDAKHGKFELALCVGDFFGPAEGEKISTEIEELVNGDIEVPMTMYVMQGDHPVPDVVIQKFAKTGSEICHNLFLLSKSGLRTTSNGLRIACLGGVYDEQIFNCADAPLGFSDPYLSAQTVEKLRENISTSTTSSMNGKTSSLLERMQASASSHLVDILISQAWPASIVRQSNTGPTKLEYEKAVAVVDDIVRLAKPKYHFSPGVGKPTQFWEREPFTWSDENDRITRFVSLGDFGGDHGTGKKPRWFYAFSISPGSSAHPQTKPANATANPFTSGTFAGASNIKRPVNMDEVDNFIFGAINQPASKKPRRERGEPGKPPPGYKCRKCESTEHFITDCPERDVPPEDYVCKICKTPGHFLRDCPEKNAVGDTGGKKPPPGYVCRACASELHLIQDCPVTTQTRREPQGRKGGPPKVIGPGECWFCLSNPSLAKHLIVGIGSECYVTLTKGPIIPTGNYAEPSSDISKVPGGGHALIVPIAHFPTFLAVPPDLAESLTAEIKSYKKALALTYAAHGCVAVSFEVGLINARGGHGHAQVVPVPQRLAKDVERTFQSEAERIGLDFEEVPEKALQSCEGGHGSYFRVDLPDGRMMIHLVKQDVPFSIQFGRQVICKLLGIPERFDWKTCSQSGEEENADAQAFKEAFASFDPAQNT